MRETSLLAYREEKQRLSKMCKQVHWYIRNFPDRTDQELTRIMRYNDPNKVRPRRKELLDQGLIVESGTRRCTVTGKTATTWRATE